MGSRPDNIGVDPVTTSPLKSERLFLPERRKGNTPAINSREGREMLNPYFVSGFVDGEGSFSVTLTPRATQSVGWEVRPSFSVSQNKTSRKILFELKDFFGCGFIRPSRKDNMLKYEIRSLTEIQKKIIPHFEKYPLHTAKQRDFEIFKKVVELMLEEKHLRQEGFREILILLEKLNPRSKKIYSRKKIRELMNV